MKKYGHTTKRHKCKRINNNTKRWESVAPTLPWYLSPTETR